MNVKISLFYVDFSHLFVVFTARIDAEHRSFSPFPPFPRTAERVEWADDRLHLGDFLPRPSSFFPRSP